MFSSLRIAFLLLVVAGLGTGYLYVKQLQDNLEIARANAAKLEVALQTSEQSLELERSESARLGELNNELSVSLQRAERYGDELRATLQRHNLTHLATQKPGLIQPRMQRNTDELWKDLTDITDPDRNDRVLEPIPD
jgi:uncharacterized protein HemX